jgi:hypothetical protein
MTDQPFREDPADPQPAAPPPPPAPAYGPPAGSPAASPVGSPVPQSPAPRRSLPTMAEFGAMELPIPRIAYYVGGAAAIVVFLSTFLPWFSVSVSLLGRGVSQSGSGTDAPVLGGWTLLLSLAVLAALVLMLLRPDPRLWLALPIAGGLVVLFVLISLARLGRASGDLGILQDTGVDVSSGVGLWLTLLGGIGLLAAGFLSWRARSASPVA